MKTTGLTASEETTLRYERALFAYPHACTHSHRSSHLAGTSWAPARASPCSAAASSCTLRSASRSYRSEARHPVGAVRGAGGRAALLQPRVDHVDQLLRLHAVPRPRAIVLRDEQWQDSAPHVRELLPRAVLAGARARPHARPHAADARSLLTCVPCLTLQVPAVLAGTAAALGYLGDSGPWCALGPAYSREYLLCFYLPLVCAFAFNIIVYALVRRHSRERRVSRTTSLYLLGFVIVWFPSLLRRLQVRQGAARRRAAAAVPTTLGGASTDGAPPPAAAWQVSYMKRSPAGYLLAVGEAVCMPLQGALNAAVYGWSLPSIRRAPHCPLPTYANRASRCILRRTLPLPR
eukprot:scaffold56605_cov63-Phaeocystis_antarctica.AAC.2